MEALRNELRMAEAATTSKEDALTALASKAKESKAAPVEAESRAMHGKFAESTFTLVYAKSEAFYAGLESVGAPSLTALSDVCRALRSSRFEGRVHNDQLRFDDDARD